MAFYIAHFSHPDEQGWQRWLRPHLDWVGKHVAAGTIWASGPVLDDLSRGGLLVAQAAGESELEIFLASDPFAEHGIIADRRITHLDPLLGALQPHSSAPDGVEL